MAGLRETKKARTRQRIADVATELFVARGFDAVTVAEVADAAEVSKMTVFNHFPRKEDMLLDRLPEAVGLLTDAVRGRAPGTSPVDALHGLAVGLADQRHPLGAVRDGVRPFLRTVQDSPALVARVREITEEFEETLTGLLDEAGVERPGLVAAMAIAAYRTVHAASWGRLLAGETSVDVLDDHLAALHDASEALRCIMRTPPPRGACGDRSRR